MPNDNVTTVRRFYEEVFDRGNTDAADEFLASGATERDGSAARRGSGLDSFKRSLARLREAFPDIRVTIEDIFAVGDKVVVRWTDRGTHQGKFLGMAPTGRPVSAGGITIFRFEGGKIVEQWTNWDTLSLMAQIGLRGRLPRDLVGRMLAAQEEERRQVAYEVHDGLAQTAFAAQQLLENFAEKHPPASAPAAQELTRCLELIRQVVDESRAVIGQLRPTALDDLGPAYAIRSQVDALRSEGWEVDYEETLGDERLSAPVETALFRVAQEALTNVRKHAGTTRVRVRLGRVGREVRLRVRDWGHGLPETGDGYAAAGERIGLYGMQERVMLLGGEFEICGRPAAGTLVVARIPLPESAEEGSLDAG